MNWRGLASSLVFSRPWSHLVPWRLHTRADQWAMEHAYPRDLPPSWQLRESAPEATLLFAGDLALHRWTADDSCERVFGEAAALFRSVDFRVANLETVLTTHEEPSGKLGRFLKAEPSTIACLQYLGIDVACVANNHALDFGGTGLADSVRHLQVAGIDSVGLDDATDTAGIRGATTHIVNDIRIGMVAAVDHFGGTKGEAGGASPVWLDHDALRTAVRTLDASCDIVVAQLHWGYEYVVHPLRSHRDLARQLVEDGADIVCCHHAHVPMGAEQWAHGVIAHGLGNFWFGSPGRTHPAFRNGTLLRVGVDRQGVVAADVVPVYTDHTMALHVEEQCVPGYSRLCRELHADRTLDRVETSRVSVEVALILQDLAARIADGDAAGLLERQHGFTAPRHEWLLRRAVQQGREWRTAVNWLRGFQLLSSESIQRLAIDPVPRLRTVEAFADPRRLVGRWP